MDRGAWRATVHGVTKSGTRVKRLGMRTSKDVQEWYEPKEGNRRGPQPPGKRNPSESRRWNSAPTAWFHLGSELCLARSSAHSTRVTPKFLQSLDLPTSGIRPCLTSHGYWPAGVGGPAICREGVISGGPSKTLPTVIPAFLMALGFGGENHNPRKYQRSFPTWAAQRRSSETQLGDDSKRHTADPLCGPPSAHS